MKNRSGTQVRQNASKRGMSDGAKALSMWSNYGPIGEFVHQQNLALYRKLLAESPTDDSRRMMLAKLLAEENAKEKTRGKIRRSK